MVANPDGSASTPAGAAREPHLATRAVPPAPRRLSRRALATSAGVGAVVIATALGVAMTSNQQRTVPPEQVAISRRQTADVLADAPKDYSAVPLAAAQMPPPGEDSALSPQPAAPGTTEPALDGQAGKQRDTEIQQLRQRRDSARASKLFAGEAGRSVPVAEAETETSAAMAEQPDTTKVGETLDRRTAFVTGGAQPAPSVNSGRLEDPSGRFVLAAGSTIAAALITGLSSDLPGQVIAQVTEDVFDSATGQIRLIPQGAKLIGAYDARVSYGQSRALTMWTRMILPDGRSISLDRLVGTDPAGRSGFTDRVDHHTGRLLEGALLSVLFGVGANAATRGDDRDGGIAAAIRESSGRTIEDAGDRIVERVLSIQPTITIRPGAKVRVMVSRDLSLAPWPDR